MLRLLDALEASPEQDPHSLIIVRHGKVVLAGWWAPYSAERTHLLYSLSKSFTSTATGFAVAEGLLSLDDRVIGYFPELDAEITDARTRSMLVRHLASMATGHTTDTWEETMRRDPREPVRGFLLQPPDRAPGSVFAYNQSATYTLAAILQRVTGQTLIRYLRPRLFDPLGLPAVGWQSYPPGRNIGFTGLFATTETVARLGQLYLQGGVWEGKPGLPEGWVAEATRVHITTADSPNASTGWPEQPDWAQGYGFQFWMSRHGYRGDGAWGQLCLVLPEVDAVVAMTGQTADMQGLLNIIWENLLPQFGESPAPSPAEEHLRERIAALSVPAPADVLSHIPLLPWASATAFAPAGAVCDALPTLTGIVVAADPDGWTVSFEEGEWRLRSRLGVDEWAVTDGAEHDEDAVPVALNGGWIGDGSLRFDVIFLETPHRLVVRCDLSDRTFTAHWVSEPGFFISRGLRDMRAPRPLG